MHGPITLPATAQGGLQKSIGSRGVMISINLFSAKPYLERFTEVAGGQ